MAVCHPVASIRTATIKYLNWNFGFNTDGIINPVPGWAHIEGQAVGGQLELKRFICTCCRSTDRHDSKRREWPRFQAQHQAADAKMWLWRVRKPQVSLVQNQWTGGRSQLFKESVYSGMLRWSWCGRWADPQNVQLCDLKCSGNGATHWKIHEATLKTNSLTYFHFCCAFLFASLF